MPCYSPYPTLSIHPIITPTYLSFTPLHLHPTLSTCDNFSTGGEKALRVRRIKIKRSPSGAAGGIGSKGVGSGGTSYSRDAGGSLAGGIDGVVDVSSLGAIDVIDTTADTITDGTEGNTSYDTPLLSLSCNV